MPGKSWGAVAVAAVTGDTATLTSTGDLKQLYPNYMSVGTTAVGNRRRPTDGRLFSLDVVPDGTNGGVIEIWDIDGGEAGADVNTATAITNAQLVAAQALGRAELIWTAKFSGTESASFKGTSARVFAKGLAARFYNAGPTGTCWVNLSLDGGAIKV